MAPTSPVPNPPAYAPYPTPPQYPYPPPAYYPTPELVPTQPPASDSDQTFSLTLSPLHLIFPIVQLTGELRAAPHFGISVIAGYGEIGVDESGNALGSASQFTTYELGGRLIGYPLKKFKSLQLGGQLLYVKVDSNGPISNTDVTGTAAGFAFAPFAGYKLITAGGFTLFAQFGVNYLVVRANAHDSSGNTGSDSEKRFAPLVNFDVGWSF